jgi:hypothetical protein
MIILRQPSEFPITLEYSGLESLTDYSLKIYSNKSALVAQYEVTSDGDGTISQELDKFFEKFDDEYVVNVFSLDEEDEPENTVVIDNLSIKRPYVNPYLLGETEEEDQDAVYNERISRAIIDAVTGGFYYKYDTIDIVALGGDYLAVPNRVNRINHIYKNNMMVYDRFASASVVQDTYFITPDHTAITIQQEGLYNRSESKPVRLPLAASDSFNLYNDSDDPIAALTKIRELDLFPTNYDYTITGEFGYPVVPVDIQDATRMLVEDIKCGKLDYINKYINEYRTDQFTIKYNDFAWRGTGNRIVDQILQGYATNFYKLGVL